jgi:hypothetical protein
VLKEKQEEKSRLFLFDKKRIVAFDLFVRVFRMNDIKTMNHVSYCLSQEKKKKKKKKKQTKRRRTKMRNIWSYNSERISNDNRVHVV